jgi:hypothetical protein
MRFGRMGPPTPDQLTLAEALGIKVTTGMTNGQVSDLISAAPASDTQRKLAASMGLELPPGTNYGMASHLIHETYKRTSREVVRRRRIKVNDVFRRNEQLWLVVNIFEGWRLSMRPIAIAGSGEDTQVVITGGGKIFHAYTFRDAEKVEPQDLKP